jgi:hypothetical protein
MMNVKIMRQTAQLGESKDTKFWQGTFGKSGHLKIRGG